jgi:outer membrane lipoprotein SlyB
VIPLGTRVLVITGNQARIVPDYTDTQTDAAPHTAGGRRPAAARPAPPVPPRRRTVPVEGTAPLPTAPRSETLPDLSMPPESQPTSSSGNGLAPIAGAPAPARARPLPPPQPPQRRFPPSPACHRPPPRRPALPRWPSPPPTVPAETLAPIAGPAIR